MLKIGDTVKINIDKLIEDKEFDKDDVWLKEIEPQRFKIINFIKSNETIVLDRSLSPYTNIVYSDFIISTIKEDRQLKLKKLWKINVNV